MAPTTKTCTCCQIRLENSGAKTSITQVNSTGRFSIVQGKVVEWSLVYPVQVQTFPLIPTAMFQLALSQFRAIILSLVCLTVSDKYQNC